LSEIVTGPLGPDVHIYDHHPSDKDDIRGSREVIENVGATATIFVEILKKEKIPMSPMEATILCLGIYEETGSLLFPSTTERDLLAVAYLLKRGASLKIVSNYMQRELSKEELDLLNELVQSSREMEINGTKVKTVKASREDYVGDAAHLAHRIMDMEDIDGLILLLSMQGKILMIGRSRVAELDVAEVMKHFGGGGHPNAASATAKEASLELVEEEIWRILKASIKQVKNARDVMTTPVITIGWADTLKNAETILTRYGVNVLPVVSNETYRGIISREIIEKAIFHGFGNSRVADFTTTDALTVDPDAPMRDVERLMVEQNQRFMPVVHGSRIIGAITRTDILRTLYEDMLRRSRVQALPSGEKPSMGRNLAHWVRDRFPPAVADMLKLAGDVAEGLGFSAYLVGGSVRDLLRGQENLDIDIVIEGDGILFAMAFGKQIGAKVRTHERFGTAHVFSDVLRVDVATARTEYYESPAALPTVETSSIKKDLYRRDFTINTLAIKLNPKDFGLLIDFFGGQRDLREKTIRVLHNLSFIEDPTRAFRAIRFSERFGFKLSKHTENLIKSALRMNLFDRLSGSRLYEELLMTFNETEPVKAIKRLSEYALLKVLHPNLIFDSKIESRLQSLNDTLSWFKLLFLEEKPDIGTLYLMALLADLGENDRETAFERLSTPSKMKKKISAGIRTAKNLLPVLPLRDPAKIYGVLCSHDIETVLFAMAITPDTSAKREISQYLLQLRRIQPLLKGNDLKDLGLVPGPFYSVILNALLEEKLRGRLKTRDDEVAFVRQRYVCPLKKG
jgi:tRNA nucleotidyltransferase (CCA-adding enzyme)